MKHDVPVERLKQRKTGREDARKCILCKRINFIQIFKFNMLIFFKGKGKMMKMLGLIHVLSDVRQIGSPLQAPVLRFPNSS